MALVEMPTDPQAKLSHLRITKAQRKEVRARLEKLFGRKVHDGMKAGQSYQFATAAGLDQFLGGAFKSSDE